MGCCGDRRAATTARFGQATRVTQASYGAAPAAVQIRYIGSGAVAVVGTVTARTYTFRAPGAIDRIDARDVAGLLRTGRFQRL